MAISVALLLATAANDRSGILSRPDPPARSFIQHSVVLPPRHNLNVDGCWSYRPSAFVTASRPHYLRRVINALSDRQSLCAGGDTVAIAGVELPTAAAEIGRASCRERV